MAGKRNFIINGTMDIWQRSDWSWRFEPGNPCTIYLEPSRAVAVEPLEHTLKQINFDPTIHRLEVYRQVGDQISLVG